jgi:2',3'-cyclic-nucleotide 2'-phosphodiesterase (5'-nucleotidase family)
MKKINKMLALVMALAMIFSLSISASAAVTVEWSKERYEEAATKIDKVPADLSGKTVILHTNDVHGAVAQYAKLAALKADFEASGATVLLVDAGDYSSGDPNVSLSKGKSAIELMNAVGYDYATLGNHEFDYGWTTLEANLKDAKFTVLSDVQYQGKDAFAVGEVKALEAAGLKIGFFGLTTPETATKAHPGKTAGVTWPEKADMMKAAQTAVDKLKADGADLVIGIVHLGIEEENVPNSSRDLYKEVTGIDFIIDGHSHAVMTAGEDKEPIQSTGTKLVNVGVIVIDNATKKIESNCLFDLANYTKEVESVKTISDRVIKEVNDEYGAVFAVSAVDLDGANKIARFHETNLGDLIADAMLWHIKEGGMSAITVPADRVVALTNGGGIREDIKTGDVTKKDVNTVLPFGNTVKVVYVTGAELLEALEASTRSFPMGGFPQVAGIKFTIDDAKAYNEGAQYPGSTYYAPKTIERVTIDNINGKAFDAKATYAVITNDFLADGGDTYYAFAAASAKFDTSIPMDEVVMDYIKTELKGTITAEKYGKADGRITIKEDPIKAYTDVDASLWYAAALRYAVENKIMNGTAADKFSPNGTVTRGMVMTILARMEGVDTAAGEGEQWYDKGVAWAKEKGISDGTNPTGSITREQFATMLYRYEQVIKEGGFKGDWMFLLDYPDAASVNEWANEAMHWMSMNKVVNGMDGKLNPQGSATRAQVAQMLLNYSNIAK